MYGDPNKLGVKYENIQYLDHIDMLSYKGTPRQSPILMATKQN